MAYLLRSMGFAAPRAGKEKRGPPDPSALELRSRRGSESQLLPTPPSYGPLPKAPSAESDPDSGALNFYNSILS